MVGAVETLRACLGQDWGGVPEGACFPAPTLVCMDSRAVLAGPWQQVRGPGKVPWRGWACSFSIAERPSASCCQLCFPPERDLVFSWQRRGCWEGKIEPASFLVELEAWGPGCSCPLGD